MEPNISENCVFCNDLNTAKHLLFDCRKVKVIWQKIGDVMKLDIKWKHILLGFSIENKIGKIRNIIITIICKAIHSNWSRHCENNRILEKTNIKAIVAYKLKFYSKILEKLGEKKMPTMIEQIISRLIEI